MPTHSQPAGSVLLILSSLIGFAIALYYYFMPMTGVTGTAGALLVVVSTLLLALGGFILLKVRAGVVATTVRILILLDALGTITAAWFLHEFWLVAVTIIALLGAIIDFASAQRDRK